MPYYGPWVLLVVTSLWAGVTGFLWALHRGQFSEQERARFLPLRDENLSRSKESAGRMRELYVLLAVIGVGGVMMGAVLLIALAHRGG